MQVMNNTDSEIGLSKIKLINSGFFYIVLTVLFNVFFNNYNAVISQVNLNYMLWRSLGRVRLSLTKIGSDSGRDVV